MNDNEVLLKTTDWRSSVNFHKREQEWKYDSILDMLCIYFAPRRANDRIITRYLDRHVGLLYRDSDKEIVGLYIEAYKESFLPRYADKEWRFTNTGSYVKGIRDIIIDPGSTYSDKASNRRRIVKPIFADCPESAADLTSKNNAEELEEAVEL